MKINFNYYLKNSILLLFLVFSVNANSQSKCQGDCQNGFGIFKWENGDKYVGDWVNGKREGQGSMTWTGGTSYSGSFKNNQLDGYGTCTWKNGNKYAGNWKNDKQDGKGVYFYSDGTKKGGTWENGEFLSTDFKSGCISGDCENGWGTWVWDFETEWAGDKYVGNWKGGKLNGKGTYFYSSGSNYNGNYITGKKNGEGTYYWTNGEKYSGTWVDGKRTGYGTYYDLDGLIQKGYFSNNVYEGENNNNNNNIKVNNSNVTYGCISGDCKEGYGTYTWESGEKYEGYWKNDKRKGQGTNNYANGDVYKGDWKDDQQNGYGTYTFSSGDKYSGNYINHRKNGNGTYYYKDGRKYAGNWKDDKYDGQGTFYATDGTTKSGTWSNGTYVGASKNTYNESKTGCVSGNCNDGYGVWEFASGERYEGYWQNTMRNGEGTNNYKSGAVFVGTWKDDKRHGYGNYTFVKGGTYESYMGNYSEDKMHGQGTLVYVNGQKYIGSFKNGLYDGEGTLYNIDGTVQSAGIWKENKFVGTSEDNYGCVTGNCKTGTGTYVFENGAKYIGSWSNGKYNGQGTYFYASGDKYIGEFNENMRDGQGTYTFAIDNRKYIGGWKNDKFDGEGTMYYSNGTTKGGNWKNGEYLGEIQNTNNPPSLTWLSPEYFSSTTSSQKYSIKVCVESKSPVKKAEVYVNNVLQINDATRGFNVVTSACDYTIEKEVSLIAGENKIKIIVQNSNGTTTSDIRTITFTNSNTEKRLALIIGNSSYATAPLKNPTNDANAIGSELKKLGFEVMLFTNITQAEMKKQIRNFGEKLASDKGIGLFYYAGHGLQVNGENYLVPVDANIQKEQDIEFEALNLSRVMGEMDYAQNTMNIVILDACRNNPFTKGPRSVSIIGLATTTAPQGTYIAYSTAPGSVAADGTANNGLYTQELLKSISKPGIKIEDVFKQVRTSVYEKSNKAQVPWENSSIFGDFYFVK
jgi:hypothetical protein